MLYATLAILFGIVSSAPLDSCGDQLECLLTEIHDNGDGTHEICLWWDSKLAQCSKDGTISHACPSSNESDKIEGFRSGKGNAMCKTVECGTYANFGLKDGKGCGGGNLFSIGFSGVEGIICMSGEDNSYCGGGNHGDCLWMIPAPQCASTTTAPPESATTTSYSVTTSPPDTMTTSGSTPCLDNTCSQTYCVDAQCSDVEGVCTYVPCQVYNDDPVACNAADCGCQSNIISSYVSYCIPTVSGSAFAANSVVMREDVYKNDTGNNGNWWDNLNILYVYIGIAVFLAVIGIIAISVIVYKKRQLNKGVNSFDHQDDIEMHSDLQNTNTTFTTN